MVLKTNFYLINFFRACFLLKWHHSLPKYYKLNFRNYENLNIRHCLISGSCLIDQAPAGSKSGGSLKPDLSGGLLIKIKQLPYQSKPGS